MNSSSTARHGAGILTSLAALILAAPAWCYQEQGTIPATDDEAGKLIRSLSEFNPFGIPDEGQLELGLTFSAERLIRSRPKKHVEAEAKFWAKTLHDFERNEAIVQLLQSPPSDTEGQSQYGVWNSDGAWSREPRLLGFAALGPGETEHTRGRLVVLENWIAAEAVHLSEDGEVQFCNRGILQDEQRPLLVQWSGEAEGRGTQIPWGSESVDRLTFLNNVRGGSQALLGGDRRVRILAALVDRRPDLLSAPSGWPTLGNANSKPTHRIYLSELPWRKALAEPGGRKWWDLPCYVDLDFSYVEESSINIRERAEKPNTVTLTWRAPGGQRLIEEEWTYYRGSGSYSWEVFAPASQYSLQGRSIDFQTMISSDLADFSEDVRRSISETVDSKARSEASESGEQTGGLPPEDMSSGEDDDIKVTYSTPLDELDGDMALHLDYSRADLGQVPVGSKAHLEFDILNVGFKDLGVSGVDSACVCTVASMLPGELAVGESIRLRLEQEVRSLGAHEYTAELTFSYKHEDTVKELTVMFAVEYEGMPVAGSNLLYIGKVQPDRAVIIPLPPKFRRCMQPQELVPALEGAAPACEVVERVERGGMSTALHFLESGEENTHYGFREWDFQYWDSCAEAIAHVRVQGDFRPEELQEWPDPFVILGRSVSTSEDSSQEANAQSLDLAQLPVGLTFDPRQLQVQAREGDHDSRSTNSIELRSSPWIEAQGPLQSTLRMEFGSFSYSIAALIL